MEQQQHVMFLKMLELCVKVYISPKNMTGSCVIVIYIHCLVSTSSDDCTDGELRLMDGSNVREGRIEVCINNAWGTVCNRLFDSNDAEVICRQFGFSTRGISSTCIHKCSTGSTYY